MSPHLQAFYNHRAGIVDLTTQSAFTVDIAPELVETSLGGAALNARMLSSYESDSLVLGTGPLTGSFAPASALLVGTFRSRFDHLCHVPFLLRSGPDLKFSGIDVLVIRGSSKEPCAVSVQGGAVHVHALGNAAGTVPEILTVLKSRVPGHRSAIVTGPAAENKCSMTAASIGTCGSLDKAGFGLRMAEKNLKAVLLSGTGGLPFPENHPALAKAAEKMAPRDSGFVQLLKIVDKGNEAVRALRGRIGRPMACYHCPTPCLAHAKTDKQGKDGLLLTDHIGFAALAYKSDDAVQLLRTCIDLGLDPAAAALSLKEDRPLSESISALKALMSGKADETDWEDYPACSGVDSREFRMFGGGIAPVLNGSAWVKRASAAMILGVCPIFFQLAERLALSDLLRFISPETDGITALSEALERETAMLAEGSIPKGEGCGA